MMYEKEISRFKQFNIDFIKDQYKKRPDYELQPQLTVLALNKKTGQFEILPCSIDPHFMRDEKGKDLLADIVIPNFIRKLEAEQRRILCVCWMTEGWWRNVEVLQNDPRFISHKEGRPVINVDAVRKHVKPQEIVSLAFFSYEAEEHKFWLIHRQKKFTSLEAQNQPYDHVSGRFTQLFKKVFNPKNN